METANQTQTQYQDSDDGPPNRIGQMTAQSTTRPSLLNPKQFCYIGACNVRTMYEACKTAQIEREMQKYNIQVLGK
jgi:hypothetical protein